MSMLATDKEEPIGRQSVVHNSSTPSPKSVITVNPSLRPTPLTPSPTAPITAAVRPMPGPSIGEPSETDASNWPLLNQTNPPTPPIYQHQQHQHQHQLQQHLRQQQQSASTQQQLPYTRPYLRAPGLAMPPVPPMPMMHNQMRPTYELRPPERRRGRPPSAPRRYPYNPHTSQPQHMYSHPMMKVPPPPPPDYMGQMQHSSRPLASSYMTSAGLQRPGERSASTAFCNPSYLPHHQRGQIPLPMPLTSHQMMGLMPHSGDHQRRVILEPQPLQQVRDKVQTMAALSQHKDRPNYSWTDFYPQIPMAPNLTDVRSKERTVEGILEGRYTNGMPYPMGRVPDRSVLSPMNAAMNAMSAINARALDRSEANKEEILRSVLSAQSLEGHRSSHSPNIRPNPFTSETFFRNQTEAHRDYFPYTSEAHHTMSPPISAAKGGQPDILGQAMEEIVEYVEVVDDDEPMNAETGDQTGSEDGAQVVLHIPENLTGDELLQYLKDQGYEVADTNSQQVCNEKLVAIDDPLFQSQASDDLPENKSSNPSESDDLIHIQIDEKMLAEVTDDSSEVFTIVIDPNTETGGDGGGDGDASVQTEAQAQGQTEGQDMHITANNDNRNDQRLEPNPETSPEEMEVQTNYVSMPTLEFGGGGATEQTNSTSTVEQNKNEDQVNDRLNTTEECQQTVVEDCGTVMNNNSETEICDKIDDELTAIPSPLDLTTDGTDGEPTPVHTILLPTTVAEEPAAPICEPSNDSNHNEIQLDSIDSIRSLIEASDDNSSDELAKESHTKTQDIVEPEVEAVLPSPTDTPNPIVNDKQDAKDNDTSDLAQPINDNVESGENAPTDANEVLEKEVNLEQVQEEQEETIIPDVTSDDELMDYSEQRDDYMSNDNTKTDEVFVTEEQPIATKLSTVCEIVQPNEDTNSSEHDTPHVEQDEQDDTAAKLTQANDNCAQDVDDWSNSKVNEIDESIADLAKQVTDKQNEMSINLDDRSGDDSDILDKGQNENDHNNNITDTIADRITHIEAKRVQEVDISQERVEQTQQVIDLEETNDELTHRKSEHEQVKHIEKTIEPQETISDEGETRQKSVWSETIQHPFVSSSVENYVLNPASNSSSDVGSPSLTKPSLEHNKELSVRPTPVQSDKSDDNRRPDIDMDSEDEVIPLVTTRTSPTLKHNIIYLNESPFKKPAKDNLITREVPITHTCEPQPSPDRTSSLTHHQKKAKKCEKRKAKSSAKPPKKKTMDEEEEAKYLQIIRSRLTGWERGWTPEQVVGVNSLNKNLVFLVRWTNGEQTIVLSELAKQKCPDLVIRFYEEHSVWDE